MFHSQESSFVNGPRSISLDAAGLVALADLDTVASRTVLTGTSDLLDSFVLCPGLHRQQDAVDSNHGETPPMAAMLTGYICRVENPATISYLQRIAKTGMLTRVKVQRRARVSGMNSSMLYKIGSLLISCPSTETSIMYLVIVMITCGVLLALILLGSWKGVGAIAALMFSRLCNTVVIRRRNVVCWHGASEPGVQADNLILLTQDRWIRMQGSLDDIKAVTAGQWLREATFFERGLTSVATVIVYMTAALASNMDGISKIAILILLLVSVGLLSITNELTTTLSMHGCTVSVQEPRQSFERRLRMVSTLIAEVGRHDWAVRMGLIVEDCKISENREQSPSTSCDG